MPNLSVDELKMTRYCEPWDSILHLSNSVDLLFLMTVSFESCHIIIRYNFDFKTSNVYK